MSEVGNSYRYKALWQASARVAGWVPLAEVLDALRDADGYRGWAMHQVHVDGRQPLAVVGEGDLFAEYLAERFATAPQGTDERNDRG